MMSFQATFPSIVDIVRTTSNPNILQIVRPGVITKLFTACYEESVLYISKPNSSPGYFLLSSKQCSYFNLDPTLQNEKKYEIKNSSKLK